jgi:Polyketide cyclase / dehydrase and lipid transport
MKHPPGPAPGLTPIVCNIRPKPEIVRVEYSISTKANCALAWRIFADCARWHRFSDAYRSIEWRGAPWAPGSRLQIEIVRPVVATQDRVITICTPPRCVAWINHVLGYTMEQWILFDPAAGGGTRVSTWIEFTGINFDGCDAEKLVARFVEEWFVNFCAECDRMVDGR